MEMFSEECLRFGDMGDSVVSVAEPSNFNITLSTTWPVHNMRMR